ncbi:hypothetical protein TorRG33x02_333910 [Trema orientale]|uniref:Uncharacterized protein n=1 Tax=Trema orientale TaxID=63057 RepID=A0A2P5B3N6_TREOI|nr:hypothetical protein TorRG33x02_333910 [Trema orientale]
MDVDRQVVCSYQIPESQAILHQKLVRVQLQTGNSESLFSLHMICEAFTIKLAAHKNPQIILVLIDRVVFWVNNSSVPYALVLIIAHYLHSRDNPVASECGVMPITLLECTQGHKCKSVTLMIHLNDIAYVDDECAGNGIYRPEIARQDFLQIL